QPLAKECRRIGQTSPDGKTTASWGYRTPDGSAGGMRCGIDIRLIAAAFRAGPHLIVNRKWSQIGDRSENGRQSTLGLILIEKQSVFVVVNIEPPMPCPVIISQIRPRPPTRHVLARGYAYIDQDLSSDMIYTELMKVLHKGIRDHFHGPRVVKIPRSQRWISRTNDDQASIQGFAGHYPIVPNDGVVAKIGSFEFQCSRRS